MRYDSFSLFFSNVGCLETAIGFSEQYLSEDGQSSETKVSSLKGHLEASCDFLNIVASQFGEFVHSQVVVQVIDKARSCCIDRGSRYFPEWPNVESILFKGGQSIH